MFRRSGPTTIGAYAKNYALLRDVRAGSLRQLVIAADLFERWAGGPVRLDELDETSVSAWLRDYAAQVKPATVRSKKVQILALWRAAADDGLCDPPTRRVRSVRCPGQVVECWTLEEVDRLLEACRRLQRRHRCGLPRSVWWDLAVRFAWDSGLRWGDQIAIPVAAIRPDGNAAWSQSKTGRVQAFRIQPATLEALRASLEACPRGLVMPWPASHETFSAQVRILVGRAGIRPGTWKWLRRASATDCEVQQAGTAGEQLGHRPGSRIAYDSYVSPAIVGRRGIVPRPLQTPPPGLAAR